MDISSDLPNFAHASPSQNGPRNALYLEPVYRHADRCHRLQADLTEATTYSSPFVNEIQRELQQQQLVFIRVCCDAALRILLRGKATWSNPSHQPHKKDVEEAKRLVRLADITLKTKALSAFEAEQKALSFDAVTSIAKSAHLLMGAWPSILVDSTACTVYFLGGSSRAAMARAAKACGRIQQVSYAEPSHLIQAALAAAKGHHSIAEHIIAIMSSYAAVLSSLCKLDEALRFAQLSAALCQQLHSELLVRAAFVAAGGTHEVSGISIVAAEHLTAAYSTPPALFDSTLSSYIQSPSLLAQRTPTALLTAITLHNCVSIMRRVREQGNLPCIADNPNRKEILTSCCTARQVHFLEMALDLAKAELGDLEVRAMSGDQTSEKPPKTFIAMLQQKLNELRKGQQQPLKEEPASPLKAAKDLDTHERRLDSLQRLIKQTASDANLGTGPHSAFSPTPVPSHNYNMTHGSGSRSPSAQGKRSPSARSTHDSSRRLW